MGESGVEIKPSCPFTFVDAEETTYWVLSFDDFPNVLDVPT